MRPNIGRSHRVDRQHWAEHASLRYTLPPKKKGSLERWSRFTGQNGGLAKVAAAMVELGSM
jgi:hypothetical protein